MAHWHETINIAALHRMYQNGGSIGIQQIAKGIVNKLRLTHAYAMADPELIDVIFAFNQIDEFARVKDYNIALGMLYEWGDKEYDGDSRRMWIEVEGISDEHEDVPQKVRNLFEEDTKPQFNKPHYHGVLKGPYYRSQSGSEWVKHPLSEPKSTQSFNGHIVGCTCQLCLKDRAGGEIPQWDETKYYRAGDIVRHKNLTFECQINNTNVDPNKNSECKPGQPWKWLHSVINKSFDPALAFKDRLTCESRGKYYPTGRKYRYMSEDDFNKKLKDHNIEPPTIPKELYSYWKDCEDKYQEWLIQRWVNNNLTFKQPNTFN